MLILVVSWYADKPSMVLAKAVGVFVACVAEVVFAVIAVPHCGTSFVFVLIAVVTSIGFARCLCWEVHLANSCCWWCCDGRPANPLPVGVSAYQLFSQSYAVVLQLLSTIFWEMLAYSMKALVMAKSNRNQNMYL